MGRIEGKVAIVTGGAQGIGAVYAKALAAEGARVVISDILDGSDLAGEIGDAARFIRADISSLDEIRAMTDFTVAEFGTVDILVNNAAIFASLTPKPFLKITADEFDRMLQVNVRGQFQCIQTVAPIMMEKKAGKIVNIASGVVHVGPPMMPHYTASKGAVWVMTKSLARELAEHNVQINSLCPGFVLSDQILANPEKWGRFMEMAPQARLIKRDQQPEDLVGALIFLASSDSDFMTGQSITIDGGTTLR